MLYPQNHDNALSSVFPPQHIISAAFNTDKGPNPLTTVFQQYPNDPKFSDRQV